MRFTLEKLEEIVPKILEKGLVNVSFEGYPILHSVAIELRDETNKSKHPRYFQLIKTILQHPQCNPNVFDKHKKPLLAYAVQNNMKLVSLLLEHNADPNLADGSGFSMTPLEWAIYLDADPKIIDILNPITKRTSTMKKNSKELFERALEENEVPWINNLLDYKLVHYDKKFRKNINPIPEFKDGLWIRTITDLKRECAILKKREAWDEVTLAQLRHREAPESDSHYTPYSPATFVTSGLPISLFGFEDPGIMIRPSNRPIAYWYDGHQEELTRERSYKAGRSLSNGQREGQHYEVTAETIKSILQQDYLKEVKKCYTIATEKPEPDEHEVFDRHGVLLDRMLCDIQFRWNEGLLRYQSNDIVGIHVDPKNKETCIKALELRKMLQVNVPLYCYNEDSGGFTQLRSKDLIQKWGLSTEAAPTATNNRNFFPSGGPREYAAPSINRSSDISCRRK